MRSNTPNEIRNRKSVGKNQKFSPDFLQKSLVYFLDNCLEIKYNLNHLGKRSAKNRC